MAELPTGTVTFLFADIQGGTALARQYPAALPALLARHHAILHERRTGNLTQARLIYRDTINGAGDPAGVELKALVHREGVMWIVFHG